MELKIVSVATSPIYTSKLVKSDVEMDRNLLNSIKSFMYQWYQYFNNPQNANLDVVLQ